MFHDQIVNFNAQLTSVGFQFLKIFFIVISVYIIIRLFLKIKNNFVKMKDIPIGRKYHMDWLDDEDLEDAINGNFKTDTFD